MRTQIGCENPLNIWIRDMGCLGTELVPVEQDASGRKTIAQEELAHFLQLRARLVAAWREYQACGRELIAAEKDGATIEPGQYGLEVDYPWPWALARDLDGLDPGGTEDTRRRFAASPVRQVTVLRVASQHQTSRT